MDSKYLHKDFHGALSCGFIYVTEKYGQAGFEEYCKRVARNAYFDLIEDIKTRGLEAIKEHWKRVFEEEGGDFLLFEEGEVLVLQVNRCPAISHMKERNYRIADNFCEHTRLINGEICALAGYDTSCQYVQGEGRCLQRFWKRGEDE